METKTELLDAVELELGAAATVTDLHAALQARLGWEAPERLERCAQYNLCLSWERWIWQQAGCETTRCLARSWS